MTKKRFKMSMAALGALAVFFMVLIAVLLAPTLASVGRDSGGAHRQGGMPETGPSQGGAGGTSQMFAENWNEAGHDHGNAYDMPFCVEDGAIPCADRDPGNAFGGADDTLGNPGNFAGDYAAGSGANGQDGTSNGGGRYSPNFWGGGPGVGAGNSDKPDTDESDDPDSGKDGDKTNKDDANPTLQNLTPPGDDKPSDFGDPTFDDEPKSEDPKGGNPPVNPLAPETEVTEIPEPLTVSLFAVGLAGAAGLRRRSRRQA